MGQREQGASMSPRNDSHIVFRHNVCQHIIRNSELMLRCDREIVLANVKSGRGYFAIQTPPRIQMSKIDRILLQNIHVNDFQAVKWRNWMQNKGLLQPITRVSRWRLVPIVDRLGFCVMRLWNTLGLAKLSNVFSETKRWWIDSFVSMLKWLSEQNVKTKYVAKVTRCKLLE